MIKLEVANCDLKIRVLIGSFSLVVANRDLKTKAGDSWEAPAWRHGFRQMLLRLPLF